MYVCVCVGMHAGALGACVSVCMYVRVRAFMRLGVYLCIYARGCVYMY